MVGKFEKSAQAKELQRRLSIRLFLMWLVFTAAFTMVAFLLNATVVPRIADFVADQTSEWMYWEKKDYPLSECLRILDAPLFAVCDSNDVDKMDELLEDIERRISALSMAMPYLTRSQLYEQYGALMGSDLIGYENIDDIPQDAELLVMLPRFDGSAPVWTNLPLLQREAIYSELSPIHGLDTWQFFETDLVIEGRDLYDYYLLRDLKVPIVITLYLMGCILVVFIGLNKSFKYFDELARAVADMLEDRTKPVRLSKQLLITQNELNSIRLGSLADERAADVAERRKDELVAYLAHDIKTPLTSVMGYLMLLDEAPDLPEEVRARYIRIASEKTQRLEDLIDEFFEITRYNLHSIPIERENVDLLVLCQQVVDEFFPACEARGISIEVNIAADSNLFVDPGKFARALGNVVRNAVAYAEPKSTIKVEAERMSGKDVALAEYMTGDDVADDVVDDALDIASDGSFGADCDTCSDAIFDAKSDSWVIRVSNKGKEISEVHLKSIFEKFYRADGSRSSESGRSGLGLAIAKEIIGAHRGRIFATSELGVTTFTIVVPQ